MNKKHGWVRQANNTGNFVMTKGYESKSIKDAHVFPTRKEARISTVVHKIDVDIVRKVSLTKNGKAKKIIGRG